MEQAFKRPAEVPRENINSWPDSEQCNMMLMQMLETVKAAPGEGLGDQGKENAADIEVPEKRLWQP